MSRSVLYIAGLALLLAVASLVLQFALQPEGGSDDGRIAALESQVLALQSSQATGGGMRVAYLNAEDAFQVFVDATDEERERVREKVAEIEQLQSEYAASTISRDDYQQRVNELQAEFLDAQLTLNINTLERMIASDEFAAWRGDLADWQETAQLLSNEVKNLVSMARMGVVDLTEYQSRYTTAQSAFSQFDQGLTAVATAKIVEVAKDIAKARGYDMVLRVKNVLIYRNDATLDNITDLVMTEINGIL